jgi:hypothetical protein
MAEPVRVRDLLEALPGVAERLAEARLLAAWPEIAGPAAARSRAEAVEEGVLRVAVDSSGWLHHLTLDEPALLARCRAAVPTTALRAIRFRLASLAPPGAPAPSGSDSSAGSADTGPPLGPPPDEMKALIDAALGPVRGHPGIAEALGRVIRATRVARGEGEVPR